MSIETLLTETIEAMTSLTTAINRMADNQDRLIAGQEAVMAKVEGGKAPATRTRKVKEDAPAETPAPATKEEPADTASAAEDAKTVAEEPKKAAAIPTSADDLKAYVASWTGSTDDTDERADRVTFLKSIAEKVGVPPRYAELLPHAKETVDFIERYKAGEKFTKGSDGFFKLAAAAAADEDEF